MFHIERITRENEEKLGSLILDAIREGHHEEKSDTVVMPIDTIKRRLCEANGIEDSTVEIHVFDEHEINAFALPGRDLVVYSNLISFCKSPEELSGVLAHEIAHMEHHHVTKKLAKELGLSLLTTMAGGGSSGEIARQTARVLSSTAFDREQEAEADRTAVHMMAHAGIDPSHLADFFLRLSLEKEKFPKGLSWLSTHPDSRDRASEVLKLRSNESFRVRPLLDTVTWASLKNAVVQPGR